MSYENWGPSYGDPTHPTTGELPRVGDGRATDELRTVQVDTVADASKPPPSGPRATQSEPSRYRYSWETSTPRTGAHSEPRGGWSVPRVGRDLPKAGFTGPQPRIAPDDTTQFARVGDGLRGSVGPVSVQVDRVPVHDGVHGDTQLLPTAAFMRPQVEEAPPAVESPQPEPGTGSMPAMRRQMGPDWTQTPLRLLAAAAVATAVLATSAASLISIGAWINP